jgi:hypothetical protein
MLGYPGILANGNFSRLNEPLLVAGNATFYFLVFEGWAALKRKLRTEALFPQEPPSRL